MTKGKKECYNVYTYFITQGGLMENQIIMSTQTDDSLQFILDLLQNMEADFSTGYIIASTVLSIIVGILAATL